MNKCAFWLTVAFVLPSPTMVLHWEAQAQVILGKNMECHADSSADGSNGLSPSVVMLQTFVCVYCLGEITGAY